MIRIFTNEEFKEIKMDSSLRLRYAISNFGRLISFTETFADGRILKGSMIDGYRIFRFKIRKDGKQLDKHLFFYKLVAEYFIPKTSEDQAHVLHLDRYRSNDCIANLQWATRQQMLEHQRSSPLVIEARKKLIEHNIQANGQKLTRTRVIFLKKQLLDPNRKTRIRMLAKQFGVSEMQLHRIKTGENWGHIKV